MNTEETKLEILAYFQLAQKIKKFISMRQSIEKEYYASQSFTGGMMWDLTPVPYHRSRSVEHHALTLYDMTSALDKKINMLKDRYRHFQSYLETIDVNKLHADLNNESKILSALEKNTYAEIFQIERYIKFKYRKHLLQYQNKDESTKNNILENMVENNIFEAAEIEETEFEESTDELEAIQLNLFSKLGSLFE